MDFYGLGQRDASAKYAAGDFFDRAAEKYILAKRPHFNRGLAAGGLAASTALGSLLGGHVAANAVAGKGSATPIEDIAREMGVEGLQYEHGATPAYYPADHTIVYNPKRTHESFLAHEVGHAKGGGKGNLLKATVATNKHLQGTLAPLTAYASGAKKPSYIPAGIQAVAGLPMLAEEARASGHALKYLIGKHGVGRGLLRGAPLLPAYGTYLHAVGSPLAITALRRRQLAKETQRLARKLRIGTGLGATALATGLAHHFLSKKDDQAP